MTRISSLPPYHAEYHGIRPSSLHSLYVSSCIFLYHQLHCLIPCLSLSRQHAVFIHPFPVYPFLFMSPYLLSHSRTSRPCPISQGILLPVRRSQNYIPADFSSTAMTRSAHTSTNLTLSLHMALFFDTHL